MTQEIIAKFFTFTDANGTLQITYYPLARLEYQGPDWQGSLPDEPQDAYKAIADEIIKMSEVDQQMRKSGKWDASIDVEKRQGILAQGQLKIQTTLMSEGKRWVCSRSVNMRVCQAICVNSLRSVSMMCVKVSCHQYR